MEAYLYANKLNFQIWQVPPALNTTEGACNRIVTKQYTLKIKDASVPFFLPIQIPAFIIVPIPIIAEIAT